MSTDEFSLSFLEELISDDNDSDDKDEKDIRKKYPVRQQNGPLRFIETTTKCANYRCGSPTTMKVQGVPRCMMHSLIRLNELLIEKGVSLNAEIPRS